MSSFDEIITRQYDETGSMKYNQVLSLKHLVTQLLESNFRGNFKVLQYHQKHYPGIAKIVKGTKL